MSTTKTQTVESNPFAAIGEVLETAASRFEEGTSNARENAKHAADSTKKAVTSGLYNGSFGLSYGIVFATVYVTELLPKDSVVRRGLEDGADAAFEAHEKRAVANGTAEPAESAKPAAAAKPKRARKSKASKK
jgi:hypothetical protein